MWSDPCPISGLPYYHLGTSIGPARFPSPLGPSCEARYTAASHPYLPYGTTIDYLAYTLIDVATEAPAIGEVVW